MHLTSPHSAFLIAIVVQALGLASAVAVRVTHDVTLGSAMRLLFFSTLAVLGLVTHSMIVLANPLWLPCGITLALMVVGATLDIGSRATHTAS
jgi:hypothetical protein